MTATATKKVATTYKILRSVDRGGTWAAIADVTAYNGDAALRKHLAEAEGWFVEGVQYLPVPARSWRPFEPRTTSRVVTSLVPARAVTVATVTPEPDAA